ncbi:hypothetical protein Q4Q39_13830 [Flavivirga amylovorans]|uniref:Uncharacterized protein n=1 Tax=Flavivirga amylovorans TaxID=870486 RepID=A0ABT8X3E9_9FLAO|nr:hypothetical protein [Flavivirga amylovorans]MDO5988488.1 hypothetical protein [Flavivirga amylovorans]
MDIDVVPNDQIKIENDHVTYNEVYLFSQERNICITGSEAKLNEDIYIIFEKLQGFKVEDGKLALGLSLKATDSEGGIIVNEEDLIGDSVMEVSELEQLAPSFIFSGSNVKNPVTCEVVIWDKKSDSKIKASVELNVK